MSILSCHFLLKIYWFWFVLVKRKYAHKSVCNILPGASAKVWSQWGCARPPRSVHRQLQRPQRMAQPSPSDTGGHLGETATEKGQNFARWGGLRGKVWESALNFFFFSWVKSVLPVMVLHMWPPCLCLDPQAFFISFFPLSCWEGWAKEQLGGGLAASWCQLTAYMHWNNWASNKLIIYQKASARIPVQIERDQLV